MSRVQGEASAARIPAKSACFITPSLPEEKSFLEAAELSCPAQSLGPPAALVPLPQPQCLPLVVPCCAPHGYQAEMPLANIGQVKAMWSFFLEELAVPTASPCTLLPTPQHILRYVYPGISSKDTNQNCLLLVLPMPYNILLFCCSHRKFLPYFIT